MKHLTTYKMFESFNHKGINYYYEWAMPSSKTRREVDTNLSNMLLDAKDLGYGAHTGWITEPYVWIGGGGGRRKFDINEVQPIVDRIVSYLKSEGFNVDIDELKNQIKIIFH